MLKIALGMTFILSLSLLGIMACSEEVPAPATPPTTAPANAQPTPTAGPPTEAAAQTRALTPEPTATATLAPTAVPTAAPTPEPTATSAPVPTSCAYGDSKSNPNAASHAYPIPHSDASAGSEFPMA